jgi:catechol-2,3-dioxygenase
MPQLKPVAITTHNVEKTAKFYIDVFGMKEMGTINDSGTVERGAGFKGSHHIGFEVEDMATSQEKLAAAGSTRRHDVEQALGVMPGECKHNVEVKYTGPDGVMVDVSETGWIK